MFSVINVCKCYNRFFFQEIAPELLAKPQVQFALTLYHRWILRFPVKAALYAKSTKMHYILM